MPPKISKKTVEKQKQKVIEDKTFGLKNKNRSTKVQQYVQSVAQTVKSGNRNEVKAQKEVEEKKRAKEEKKAREAEILRLFKEAESSAPTVLPPGVEEVDKNFGVSPDEYLFTAEDFDEVEEDMTRLEEQLESERQALQGRTDLTPVTEATFQAWKAMKRQEALDKEQGRLKKAKTTGEGLRGWDLWQTDKDLFVDDDEADAEYYEQEETEELGC